MTDDIVTRLRGEAVSQTQPHNPCPCGICESVIGSAKEAADHIKELYEVIRQLESQLDYWIKYAHRTS